MDDSLGNIIIQDHFQASTPNVDTQSTATPSSSHSVIDEHPKSDNRLRTRSKLKKVASMLNMLSIRRLTWGSGGEEKVEISAVELASIRAELADLEERESHLKAKLENIDEILRSCCLSGYLHIRTRWEALPGEPLPIDDTEVDDWLPRFVVLHGSCIFFYLVSSDLSPQDSTLLSDVVEMGPLPSLTREDEATRYCFYVSTCHGLRFECSSASKIQVDGWLTALQTQTDCKLGSNKSATNTCSKNQDQI